MPPQPIAPTSCGTGVQLDTIARFTCAAVAAG